MTGPRVLSHLRPPIYCYVLMMYFFSISGIHPFYHSSSSGSSYLTDLLLTKSILKLHLPVLQQVVQNRQNIPLRLFQAFQDESSSFCGCTNCTLFPRDKSNIKHSGAWSDLTCSVMQRKLGLLIIGTRSLKSWAPYLGFAYSTNRILTR